MMNQDKDRKTADGLAVDSRKAALSCTDLAEYIYEALRSVREESWNEAIEEAAQKVDGLAVFRECMNSPKVAGVIRSLKKQSGGEEK